MGTTYVHGHVLGDRGLLGVRRALREAGLGDRHLVVQRQSEHPQPPLTVRRRASPLKWAALLGAIGGALSIVAIGPIVPPLLQEVTLGAWFEQWVSTSAGGATFQAVLVGGAFGALLGRLAGTFEMRPATTADTDFVVGVHVPSGSSEAAEDALRRGGSRDVERHGD